ncbi:MAG: ribonuclease III [Bacteroidetes bacterium]|nr:ribonuclease III [Bacteroidota bacterium]MBS1540869.1 ribonuclease III [Bacteroidota bacterium]
MWKLLRRPGSSAAKEDKKLITAVKTIAGFTPANISLYRLATLHSSKGKDSGGFRESNERLEYLGDAVLGAAVADYLFKKYPFKDEGFLTEIRSRIVNRESLNNLARKIGIASIVQYDNRNVQLQKVILGNTLEALVGAVYLDKGYASCKKFVIDKLIQPHFDLETVVNSDTNHKSRLLEWAQRQAKEIKFETTENHQGRGREFSVIVFLGTEAYGQGYGFTKKKAEQNAAEKTCAMLNI